METLEGGLNRNSSPQALSTFRDAYDRFLIKFPLLFGYWKKYADMEFNIAGPESAEMVCAPLLSSSSHVADMCFRCMNEAAPASSTLLICGRTTAPSRWRLPTTQYSSESKCTACFLSP